MIYDLAFHWEALKDVFVAKNEDVRALVHIHGGLAAYVVLALCARRGFAAAWPLVLLGGAEFANEALDILSLPHGIPWWMIRDSASDAFNTMLWPLVLFFVSRIKELQGAEPPVDEAGSTTLAECGPASPVRAG